MQTESSLNLTEPYWKGIRNHPQSSQFLLSWINTQGFAFWAIAYRIRKLRRSNWLLSALEILSVLTLASWRIGLSWVVYRIAPSSRVVRCNWCCVHEKLKPRSQCWAEYKGLDTCENEGLCLTWEYLIEVSLSVSWGRPCFTGVAKKNSRQCQNFAKGMA